MASVTGSKMGPRPHRISGVRLAIALSFALLLLRLSILKDLGFADAEALYACYALHPQPAYLDHPGLVGTLMGLLGAGKAPLPEAAHLAAAVMATLLPWLAAAAARATGASTAGAMRTLFALALVPEISIGLFSISPDLLLAALWLGALGCSALALSAEPRSLRALLSFLAVGVLLGVGILAKLSQVLLGFAILAALLSKPARAHLRTVAPWAALGLTAVLISPLVLWEVRHGYPMLTHRLLATQAQAGFSLRNLGALLGGQLLYVGPFFLIAAFVLAKDLWQNPRSDAISRLLWYATLVPAVALVILCLWSRVAEPHWIAPAYLALAIHASRTKALSRWLAITALASGAVTVGLAWFWVSTSLPIKLLGSRYQARYDLANDLYAWGPARRLLADSTREALIDAKRMPVVVGPHYIVCAQAHAALGNAVAVGCNSPFRDDFDVWLPRQRWLDAPVVLYVQDSRFQVNPARELPNRVVRSVASVDISRGGALVRTIRVTRLDKLNESAGRGAGPLDD